MTSSDVLSVADLLVRARAGDAHAVNGLFAACRNYVGLLARTQVESWLRAKVDASDLVQQTLLEAYRDFERFQGTTEAEWLAWLRRIVAHNAVDFARHYQGAEKRQACREVPLSPASDSGPPKGPGELAAAGESPSQQLVRRERELQLAEAISGLAADHREVIVLRNLQRLPFDEVAARMGRSRPAVQMLWTRAIRKLQEALAGIGSGFQSA
jgi:RNA polymerase sigma-70 factor (ECF subfamily)